MLMRPAVGRIVHVFITDPERQHNGMGAGPYAAMITQVYTDDCINAVVQPPGVEPWHTASILRGDELSTMSQHWRWPERV